MVQHRYLNWKDDPNTTTDDFLVKQAAWNDLISTVSGSLVAVIGAVAPLALAFSDVESNIKTWSIGGGVVSAGAGAVIARQQPKSLQAMSESRLKQKSQNTEEEF